ncbi:group 4 sigma-70 RNA polymerase sigma factor G [Kalymmatonema gypsitolerans NIES-4073]|nr:group 4 sigma-70 RNA polymerase sigma factor G [Scytonema sp. NIES-4073]
MSQQSDLELIFLARQGNKAAFGRLVLRYQPMAQRIAKRMIGNEDLAQELVQDAMLQAYLSLEKLHDPKRFKSWLYGIVLNICPNNLRRRKVILFSVPQHLDNALTKLNFVRHCPDCFLLHPGTFGRHQTTGLNSDRTYPICKLFLTLKDEKLRYFTPLFSVLLRYLGFSTALLQVGLLLKVLYRVSSLRFFAWFSRCYNFSKLCETKMSISV